MATSGGSSGGEEPDKILGQGQVTVFEDMGVAALQVMTRSIFPSKPEIARSEIAILSVLSRNC